MDAVKFIKERDRMFKVAGQAPSLSYNHLKSAEEIVREVEEWSAAHPKKTRQSIFLEQYPNVVMSKIEPVISIFPCSIDKTVRTTRPCIKYCNDCRREFWMQEVD